MADHSIIDALDAYQHHPEQLTRGHVALLTKSDPALGARARERYQEARAHAFADVVAAAINQALQTRDARIQTLEDQVLELRATVAAREPVP